MRVTSFLVAGFLLGTTLPSAQAQDVGTLAPPPPAPVLIPSMADAMPAKQLFGAVRTPERGVPQSVGFYSKGCLAGGAALPLNGPGWQVMRVSRDRFWGHPKLIAFLQRLGATVPRVSQWPGILVGDMSQPRGGPMRTGHASHQIGLDADIWLTPMPRRELTREERETMSATMIVRPDRLDIDPKVWTPSHVAVIRAVAQDPEVERVLVNPAIKKALCRDARGDRSWLQKVRPNWGHDYHMHVRLGCAPGSPECKRQVAVVEGEGCGPELDWWFSDAVLHPKPPAVPPKPPRPMMVADLPTACRAVLFGQ
ncbi:penicillin-insensitive murein endopeptidase [Ancylobacter sp. 6x-1]|uniref:Penicillin-insensitive murein endopeptidase n=1 Tax=Ancylobacter crimeensis TaxID=2579147 RepID=A0ABT0DA46_9HYPH|nr:penicillin-insensitive murein endopeptidase [Ancylobacter crimeensis]MCK0196823.1 penicillin-insensitive murein endopeptidase [Ancylobacter crimeensis]